MTERTVFDALRSDAHLVVVEAPAGCGKTYQAAEYATWLASNQQGHTLVLTHTHAACDVFRSRTRGLERAVQISTFDGFICQIAGIYHESLRLPADVPSWAFEQGTNGFTLVAEKVGDLLRASDAIRNAVVARHQVIICDEHQDTSSAQQDVVTRLLHGGSKVRVFADPLQSIYFRQAEERQEQRRRWNELLRGCDIADALDIPRRWSNGSLDLGQWILEARRALFDGAAIDLTGDLPRGLNVVRADNVAHAGGFRLDRDGPTALRRCIAENDHVMLLTGTKDLVRAINGSLGGRIPIWEGYARDALNQLSRACAESVGNSERIAAAFSEFARATVKGFNRTLSDRISRDVETAFRGARRRAAPEIQEVSQCLLDAPNHRGVARALRALRDGLPRHPAFRELRIDLRREFNEASRMDTFEDASKAYEEQAKRRMHTTQLMPRKLITTIHKAKGLESRAAIVMPCDRGSFSATEYKRCTFYVAISRATHSLTLMISPTNPSPLVRIL